MADADPDPVLRGDSAPASWTAPPATEQMPGPEDPTLVISQAAAEAHERSVARRRKGMTPDRGILLLWTALVFVLLLILILRLT